jgi:hypothetical protein
LIETLCCAAAFHGENARAQCKTFQTAQNSGTKTIPEPGNVIGAHLGHGGGGLV